MLHQRTVEPRTLEILRGLMSIPELDAFCLGGGTALALQIGHRISVYLDMICAIDFNVDTVLHGIRMRKPEIVVVTKSEGTLLTRIDGVRSDFFRYLYPVIRPIVSTEGVRLLSMEDIGAMKLDAIAGRGKKKDFFDLFFLLQHYTLESLLSFHREKYRLENAFHIMKSLTWFDDAEDDEDPLLTSGSLSWRDVKMTIREQATRL
jgi:hypothetical protein